MSGRAKDCIDRPGARAGTGSLSGLRPRTLFVLAAGLLMGLAGPAHGEPGLALSPQLSTPSLPLGLGGIVRELRRFDHYCYRPARAQWARDRPEANEIVDLYGDDDVNWLGSNVFLLTPGYYDNPAFRPREPIRGWPYDPRRDVEYRQPLHPSLDRANIGRPLCSEWWSDPNRGLRSKLLQAVAPSVFGDGVDWNKVVLGGNLTREGLEEALLVDILSRLRLTLPNQSPTVRRAPTTGSDIRPLRPGAAWLGPAPPGAWSSRRPARYWGR
ncbi:MAG: hypothetical protein ACREWG_12580 [Gammaproteobacteria bacterium]